MSSTGVNIENPLELVQKTYNLQTTTTNNNENSSQRHSSIAKISIHQPSRKNSVHDVHQVTRDELNKILIDIQENLSRFKVLLETMNSAGIIREEFVKLKDHLFKKINEFIQKLANESGKRASITSKGNSSNSMSHYPQHLVYCIEYFRSELVRGQYLFYSLTLTSSIGTATLNNTTIKPIYDPEMEQIPSNDEDRQTFGDINQMKKDISTLEEHIYLLNQRYYTQIPDWHGLDDALGTTVGRRSSTIDGLNFHRLRFGTLTQKLSRASSIGSNENSTSCTPFYRKCHIICCFCQPNYI